MCWLAVMKSPPHPLGPQREAREWSKRRRGWPSFDLGLDEIRPDVERLVEHREQAMSLAFEDFEPRVRDQLDLLFQKLDPGKRITIAAQKQDGTPDARPVLGAQLVATLPPND
jgi:hypothetical protein